MPPGTAIPRRVARRGGLLSTAPPFLLPSLPLATAPFRFALSASPSSSSSSSTSTRRPRGQCRPPSHSRPFSTANAPASQRSLFVHVKPPPQTLAERRAVLRVLERYGKTDLFKKTAANDSFICIASTTTMADQLVERSPLTYDLADSLATVPVSLSSRLGARLGAAAPAGRSFVVSIFPAPEYPHRTAIRTGPLHGPWPDDIEPTLATSPSFKNTFMYNALRGVVPESASSDALCDWRPRIALGAVAAAVASSSPPPQSASASASASASDYYDDDGESLPPPLYSHEAKAARIRDRKARRNHAARSVLTGLVDRRR